jgi:hypothetical protein
VRQSKEVIKLDGGGGCVAGLKICKFAGKVLKEVISNIITIFTSDILL